MGMDSAPTAKSVLEAGSWFLSELGKMGLHPDTVELLHENFTGGKSLDGVPAWDVNKGETPMKGAERRLEIIKEKAAAGFYN